MSEAISKVAPQLFPCIILTNIITQGEVWNSSSAARGIHVLSLEIDKTRNLRPIIYL